jgi:phage-related protein
MLVASFSYNGINLEDYGVTIISADRNAMNHDFDSLQLEDKAYSWKSRLEPRRIRLGILAVPTFFIFPPILFNDIHLTMSFIREALNEKECCQLILSNTPEYFWLAKLQKISGEVIAPHHFQANIDFLCPDLRAFSITETKNIHNIDANPKTLYESTPGTAYVEPVYLLTAGENIPGSTVILESTTTGDAIQWSGDLATNDELEIDVAHWVVRLNGTESMGTVTGKFPKLEPGINTLVVSGFGTTGTLEITYRNAYV